MQDGTCRILKLTGWSAYALLSLCEDRAEPSLGRDLGWLPLASPAPGWPVYIRELQRVHGIKIKTIRVKRDNPKLGDFFRYLLMSNVLPIAEDK